MMLIPCPWCGPRPHKEFAYGGDATVTRPADPQAASDQAWHDYVYVRANPCGPHHEYWQHVGGCRQWVKVLRDTLTHEVLAAGRPGDDLAKAAGA
jgi:heterotetrameric sarcosine oxidase delta subunit